MIKRPYTMLVDNEQAEGSAAAAEPQDPANVTQTLPAVKLWTAQPARMADSRPPAAETGMIARVSLTPEGRDHAERQDAGRTIAETGVAVAPQKDAQRKPTALIVEDTTEIAEVIEATLRRMNMFTARESHGLRAFERFAELLPDLILLDLGLPDITGWKVLDNIKEQSKLAGGVVPAVIVITAMDDAANRVVGKLQGVHTYLIKPFTVSQLETAVRQALGLEAGRKP